MTNHRGMGFGPLGLVCVVISFASLLGAGCAVEESADGVGTLSQALAPVNTLPPPQFINEDSPLFFSIAGGNPISVSDEDNLTLTVQITVTNGTFTLAGTSGLTVTGNGTFDVTATGTIEKLNVALEGARFQPATNYSGPASLQIHSSDTNGEYADGVVEITVTAYNDPPVNIVPTAVQTAIEDTPRAFTFSITDVDVGNALLLVSLTASNSTTITLPPTSIGDLENPFEVGDGTDDAEMVFYGTLPAINAALNGLVVTPPENFIGVSTLVITSNDQGAYGGGGPGADNDTVNINWSAVNDPPVNTAPASRTMVEETSLIFAADTADQLSVSDVDASTALVQVTLTAGHGRVTLGNPGAVSFTTGDGIDDVTMTFRATLSNLNWALEDTGFTPDADFAGEATLTMVSNDLGSSGSGGAKQDTDVVTITVSAVNDAPVNHVPGAQITNEDVPRVFSASNGNVITISDPDATSLQVTLTATNSTLTLGTRNGLTFQTGDGIDDATTSFIGTISAINNGLAGLSVVPFANYSGPASLTISTSDLGATGAGGEQTDVDAISINVLSVNDPPDASNDLLVVLEDALPTLVSVLDNDTFAPDVGETLSVAAVGTPLHGFTSTDGTTVSYQPAANYNGPDSFTYTLSDGAGGLDIATVSVTVTSQNDPPTANDDLFTVLADSSANTLAVLSNDSVAPDVGETLSITGVTVPAHGTAVSAGGGTSISYTPTPAYSGPDSFDYTITDSSGTTANATVELEVVAVITAPVNALPGPQTIVEDSQLFFSTVAGNPITVSDFNNPTLTVQILVTNGTFTLGGTSGLTYSGNGSASVLATGLIAALNTGLENSRFTPATDYHGPAVLTINTTDTLGESDLDTLTLAVTSFNDAPVNSAPTTAGAVEDTPKSFTLSVSDPDLSGAALIVSLAANNGTLITLPSTGALTFLTGDGTEDAAMQFTGSLSSVNTVLNGLTVTAPENYIGPSTLVITSDDQGSTGAGGARQDTDTINITWASSNDPPVNQIPGPQTVAEDSTLPFSSVSDNVLSVSDQDVAAGNMQVKLTATNGVITLGTPGAVTFTAGDGLADTTMTFFATVGIVNAALEGTFYQPNADFAGAATLTMVSNDLGNSGGAAKSDTDIINITVTAVNDGPQAHLPLTASTNEEVTRIFSSAQGNPITVSDVDATALQVSLAVGGGLLSLNSVSGLTFQSGDGTSDPAMTFTGTITAVNSAMNGLRFIPTPDFFGNGSITVLVSDLGATGSGGPLSDEQTLAVSVLPINDPPDAVADTVATVEDVGLLEIDVLANDSILPDVGETLSITTTGTPAHGTAIITSGGTRITYSPSADYNGGDSFSYTISDGNGGTDSAAITITVAPVNDIPTAVDDVFVVNESSTDNPLAVRSNDSSAPDTGETLSVLSVTTPSHGTAAVNGVATVVLYTPTPGYNGTDTLEYTLSDGNGGTDTASVAITINPVDTTPSAVDDTLSLAEDTAATVDVLANDTGIGDAPLTVTIASPPGHGTAEVQGDQTVLYTPAADYNGADSFTYTVSDSDGDSDTGEVTVTVTAVDDTPAAQDDEVSIDEDTETNVIVLGNDTGVGDQPVSVVITTDPSHGEATVVVDGTVDYLPDANFFGEDNFDYEVTDGDGDTSTASVTITIASVNDLPVAVDDAVSTRPDQAIDIQPLANDSDADGDTLTIVSVTTPAHGVATLQGDTTVHYVPTTGYAGSDSFDYAIDDGSGDLATATVTIGVGLDSDGDGLLDLDEEETYGTDPQVADTDGDGLSDGAEVQTTGTDPLDDDSDDDGLLDGTEDANGDGVVGVSESAALDIDTDGDGIQDGTEFGLDAAQGNDTDPLVFAADADPTTTTDPTRADTDGGGLNDGEEDLNHNGRVDSGETDPNDPADDAPEKKGGGCAIAPTPRTPTSSGLALLLLLFTFALLRRRQTAG